MIQQILAVCKKYEDIAAYADIIRDIRRVLIPEGLFTKIEDAVEFISNVIGVNVYEINIRSRKHENVFLRSIYYHVLYNLMGFTLQDIGNFFNRDHTTIIHSIRKIDYDIDVNYRNCKNIIKEIKNKYDGLA